jgi:hypothetical protein
MTFTCGGSAGCVPLTVKLPSFDAKKVSDFVRPPQLAASFITGQACDVAVLP